MPLLINYNERKIKLKQYNSVYEQSDLVFETLDRDGKRAEANLLETETVALFTSFVNDVTDKKLYFAVQV